MVIYDCYTERCEFMEGKNSQCYGQGSETVEGKYYCDEHLEKMKKNYEYKNSVKCEMVRPSYVHRIGIKYRRVKGHNNPCKNIAKNIYESKNYCDTCLVHAKNPHDCQARNCNGIVVDGEIYCSDCMHVNE